MFVWIYVNSVFGRLPTHFSPTTAQPVDLWLSKSQTHFLFLVFLLRLLSSMYNCITDLSPQCANIAGSMKCESQVQLSMSLVRGVQL